MSAAVSQSISKVVGFYLASLAICGSGCHGPSGTAVGRVQFADGEPVQSGSVEFRSLADGRRYASRIGADGSFALTDHDGQVRCPPGDYEVVVVQIVMTEDLAAEAHRHGRTVPRRYADYDTSGLRISVPSDSDTPLQVTIQATD